MKTEAFIGVSKYTPDIIQLLCHLVFKKNTEIRDLMGFRVIPVLKSEVSDGSTPS
jgi:hypothetical protein